MCDLKTVNEGIDVNCKFTSNKTNTQPVAQGEIMQFEQIIELNIKNQTWYTLDNYTSDLSPVSVKKNFLQCLMIILAVWIAQPYIILPVYNMMMIVYRISDL